MGRSHLVPADLWVLTASLCPPVVGRRGSRCETHGRVGKEGAGLFIGKQSRLLLDSPGSAGGGDGWWCSKVALPSGALQIPE